MKKYATRARIHATPEAVWSVLVDLPGWPGWNETVDGVDGTAEVGAKVAVRAKASSGRAIPVRVVEMTPPYRMVWRGGLPLPFLFRGERTFTIEPIADGEVEFAMDEIFDGLLSPLILPSIPDLQPDFDAFAACLKRRVERV